MLLGYARCSTEEQIKGSSIEEQIRVIHGYAMAHGMHAFDVQIYTDAGISGSLALQRRPAGSDLWRAAKKGDVIIAAKLDRMFRDALDAQMSLAHFQKEGIDLILYDMGTQPITRNDSMARFFFIMLSAFADLERNQIRMRMQDGKKAKRAKGGHAGGEAPYGQRIVGSGRTARLETDPEEQKTVELILEHRSAPLAEIKRRLQEANRLTRVGKPWHVIQIKRVLDRHAVH